MSIQKEFKVKNSIVVRNTATFISSDGIVTTGTSIITGIPTLNINFLNGAVDPRISFTRASGATYVDKTGRIQYAGNNVPRLDYSSTSTGTCLGLLIEESRTNLNFPSTPIATVAGTTTLNATIAPDGIQSATRYQYTSNASVYYYGNQVTNSTTTYYVVSAYVYPNTTSTAGTWNIVFGGTGGTNQIGLTVTPYPFGVSSYNAGNGTTANVGFTNAGNGWYRVYAVGSFSVANSNCAWGIYATGTNGDISVWGAQTEQINYSVQGPSSFIPTTTAQVTRNVDRCLLYPGSWYNPNSGTWYANFQGGRENNQATYGRVLSPSSSFVYIACDGGNTFGVSTWAGGGSLILTTPNDYWTTFGGAAVAYDNRTLTRSVSGRGLVTSGNYTIGEVPNYLISTAMGIGQNAGSPGNLLNGHITKIMYWPSKLSNIQLQSLTTSSTAADANFAGVSAPATHTATTSNFTVKQGLIVAKNLEVPDIDKLYITNLTRPTQQPSLSLNFLKGTLDPRISFTRSSGATLVGADGYIKYVGNDVSRFEYSSTSTSTCVGLLMEETRTNYLTNSVNAMPNIYAFPNCTGAITSNYAVSPDGSATAQLLTAGGVGTGAQFYTFVNPPSTTGTVITYTFYANSSTQTGGWILNTVGVNQTTVVTTGVTLAGNGWYRWNMTVTANSVNATVGLGVQISPGNSLVVWGGQVELGGFATSYIPTAGATVTRAVDTAKIDGQNFLTWFRQDQGTLYFEGDVLADNFSWPVALGTSRIGFYKSGASLLAKMANDVYSSKFEPTVGTTTTGTVFKAAISYQSGSHAATMNGATPSTSNSTEIPARIIDSLKIGTGDAPFSGHIRSIVFYPERLANTVTQALTLL